MFKQIQKGDKRMGFSREYSKKSVVLLELEVGFNTPMDRQKLRKNTLKQQISGVSHDKAKEYEERWCA